MIKITYRIQQDGQGERKLRLMPYWILYKLNRAIKTILLLQNLDLKIFRILPHKNGSFRITKYIITFNHGFLGKIYFFLNSILKS